MNENHNNVKFNNNHNAVKPNIELKRKFELTW